MNKIKILIVIALSPIIFQSSKAMEKETNSHEILSKRTFTTIEEKIALCSALGVEYIHEVSISKELRRHLVKLAITPAAQSIFKNHSDYQDCMRNQSQFQAIAQDRSATNNMIIQRINPIVGYGIIAGKNFKRGDYLGLYAGEIKLNLGEDDSDYSFACGSIIPDCPELIIDAQKKRNELAFINGSQHHSNCEARNFLVPTGEKRLIYQATQDIKSGQEILADYGDFYWATHRRSTYQELGVLPQAKKYESTFGSGFKKGFFNKK